MEVMVLVVVVVVEGVRLGAVDVVLPVRVVGRSGPRSMRRAAAAPAEQEIGRGGMLVLQSRGPGAVIPGIGFLGEFVLATGLLQAQSLIWRLLEVVKVPDDPWSAPL
jgi:hypothetical protein